MANIAIKGHATRGREVIEILEMLGGKNFKGHYGISISIYYYIDEEKEISGARGERLQNYTIFSLDEFLKKYPYKVGDKVRTIYGRTGVINVLIWSKRDNCIKYGLEADCDSLYYANELVLSEEEKTFPSYMDCDMKVTEEQNSFEVGDTVKYLQKQIGVIRQKIITYDGDIKYTIEGVTDQYFQGFQLEKVNMNEVKFDAKMSPYSNSELSIIVKDMTKVEYFRKVAEELGNLYEAKNKAYGNSFRDTFQKLGLISAVTRISDKYNRLCNLATNPDIDNLGESLDDTLRDLASYAIMTIIELEKSKQK